MPAVTTYSSTKWRRLNPCAVTGSCTHVAEQAERGKHALPETNINQGASGIRCALEVKHDSRQELHSPRHSHQSRAFKGKHAGSKNSFGLDTTSARPKPAAEPPAREHFPHLQNNAGETLDSACDVLQQVTCSAAHRVNSTALLLQPSAQPPQPSTYPVRVPQS